MEPSLVFSQGFDKASDLGSEVSSLVGFWFGVPGFEVGYTEGVSLGA